MNRFKRRVLVFLFTISFLFVMLTSISAVHAAEVAINGNEASDATITDQNGNKYTDNDKLSPGEYNVTYHWSLPNSDNIKAGDTASFFLPGNLKITNNDTFEIHLGNSNGPVIGTFTIKKGSRVGVLTFNDYFQQHPNAVDRQGTITFGAWPRNNSDTTSGSSWNINKSGWYAQNADGTTNRSLAYWNFDFNPQMKHYDEVKLVDTMSENQTIVPGSIQIVFGTFENNNVVGQPVSNPSQYYTIDGNKITFDFKNLNQAVKIYYQVKPDSTSDIIDNAVSMITGDGTWSDSAELNPGSGIVTDKGQLQFNKISATTGQVITGQTINDAFKLTNVNTKESVFGNLNSNGTVTFNHLADGTYTLEEEKAPNGYQINGQTYTVTVINGNVTDDLPNGDFPDTPQNQTANINLTKIASDTKQPLAGATFTLTNANGQVVATTTSNAEGQVTFANVADGTYTINETQAPTGYAPTKDAIKVTVKNGQATVTINGTTTTTVIDARLAVSSSSSSGHSSSLAPVVSSSSSITSVSSSNSSTPLASLSSTTSQPVSTSSSLQSAVLSSLSSEQLSSHTSSQLSSTSSVLDSSNSLMPVGSSSSSLQQPISVNSSVMSAISSEKVNSSSSSQVNTTSQTSNSAVTPVTSSNNDVQSSIPVSSNHSSQVLPTPVVNSTTSSQTSVSNSSTSVTKATKKGLPQTGDKHNIGMVFIGAGLIIIGSALGYFLIKKRH